MAQEYVVLYINGNPKTNQRTKEILKKFKELKINYKLIKLDDEIDLYGNKTTLEGFFTLDFSGKGDVVVPNTPFAVADDRVFNGFDKISENLDYLEKKFAIEIKF